MHDLLDVALLVVDALDHAGVRYSVGGSLASSFSGEPRSSIDADIVVDMSVDQAPGFLDALDGRFYADAKALTRAITAKTSVNLIHHASGIKVDLFIAASFLDRRQLDRRRRVRVPSGSGRDLFVHSPEDILLQKLLWYCKGGETSDRLGHERGAATPSAFHVVLRRSVRRDDVGHPRRACSAGAADLDAAVRRDPDDRQQGTRRQGSDAGEVAQRWQGRRGTLFLLTMHPQITGHRSRIVVLERLVKYMTTRPGVWFATHEQVAKASAALLAGQR